MEFLRQILKSLTILCTLAANGYGSAVQKSNTSTVSLAEVLEEFPTEGIWSPLLEDWTLSIGNREDKVIKQKPFMITTENKPIRPTDPSSGSNRQVTETDLYLLGAIEKLVYRVDFMEKRLRRTEELLYYVMASKNKNQEPCPSNFSRVGAFCYHFSERELNWKSSSSMCRALGSRLAELETVEENQDIVAYLQTTTAVKGKDFWTGGLNPGLLWIWSNSARPVHSNSTTDSSSNNIKGNGRCLKLAYNPTIRGYEYQGSECSIKAGYICEHDENSTSRALERIQKSLHDPSISTQLN